MLTGRIIDAGEADHIGLVLRVVPTTSCMSAALETAGLIRSERAVGRPG